MLGLTFKRDSDDVRDSLSYKLVRLLERELAHVARHDPHVPAESEPLETALEGADAVVVATNHSSFEDLLDRLPDGVGAGRPLERDRLRPGLRHGARAGGGRAVVSRVLVTGGRRHDRRGGGAAARARPATGRCASPTSARRRRWMREACEVHTGDLLELAEARQAVARLHAT